MNFLEKLDYLMEERAINKNKLSKISGVPYTTIDGFYKKGYENTKLSTIRKISEALSVSLDYLINEGDDNPPSTDVVAPLEPDPFRSALLCNFDQLNQEGRERLVETSDDMVSSGKYRNSRQDVVGGNIP